MANTTVIGPAAGAPSKPLDIRVLLAFFAIYVLWGTSFLAIRIAVEEVPPLFAAGTRFFIAGVVLYGFMRIRGTAWANRIPMAQSRHHRTAHVRRRVRSAILGRKIRAIRHRIGAGSHAAPHHDGAGSVGLPPASVSLAPARGCFDGICWSGCCCCFTTANKLSAFCLASRF